MGIGIWVFLNMNVVKYPCQPTEVDKVRMIDLISNIVFFYPCQVCKYHAKKYLVQYPINADSQMELKKWMIDFHNSVNIRNGKKIYSITEFDKDWNLATCKECDILPE